MNIYRGRSCREYSLATALYDCIEDNNWRGIKHMLVERGADPNIIVQDTGISPFHLIIGNSSEEFALKTTKLILQCSGNPNIQSDDGLTPLHIAAAWGRIEIVKLLIHFGADYEIKDAEYQTAIDYAVEYKHFDIAKLLNDEFNTNINMTNLEETNNYLLYLDKIIINNGISEAEYEVNKNADVHCSSANLQELPETTPNEYVTSWCNTHAKSLQNSLEMKENLSSSLSDDVVFNEFTCSPKSKLLVPESQHNRNVNCNPRRPNHNVIENISLQYESSSKFKTRKSANCKETDSIVNLNRNGFHFKETSRESGILTISSTSLDENSIISINDSEASRNAINNNFEALKDVNKDTSSDYFTCTETSGSENILEKNITHGSNSSNLRDSKIKLNNFDVSCVNSFVSNPSTLNKCNIYLNEDSSLLSVAEVYKYTDSKEDIVLLEKRLLVAQDSETDNELKSQSSKLSSLPASFNYDSDTLRKELTLCGYPVGPVTKTTKRVYLKKLYKLKKQFSINIAVPVINTNKVYSMELDKTLQNPSGIKDLPIYKNLEEALLKEFNNPDPARKWREGVNKSSFSYLLLDPRHTKDLPNRAEHIALTETWKTFLSSIFYVGKGKRARPYSHLYEAVKLWQSANHTTSSTKLHRILDIWKDNYGVVCLHVFQNVIPVEAYTREAAMIGALKVENIENSKLGQFYGSSLTWSLQQQNMLGVLLLYKAMSIFLNEGERQLRPDDIN